MNKIEAITELLSGKVDAIKKGTSIFILKGDDIVNKRTKRPIDTKHMLEDGWETVIEPKWYDNISPDNPVLCWIEKTMNIALVVERNEEGKYKTIYEILVDHAEPIKYEEAVKFIIDAPKKRRKTTEKQIEQKEDDNTQKDEIEAVTFDGTPAIVDASKDKFVELGLPEDYWFDFININNFDSISIIDAINKGDDYLRGLIAEYLSRRNEIDNEEIPF
jgi:hypothetical protein